MGIPDVGVGAAALRGIGFQEPNLAFPVGMPPQHLIEMGLFHDQDTVRLGNQLRRKSPGLVPRAVNAFFPEDGNGMGIGASASEIEQTGGGRLHVMKVLFFQLLPEDSLRHETPAQIARAYEQNPLCGRSGRHGISQSNR
jgi:hypothetical protein